VGAAWGWGGRVGGGGRCGVGVVWFGVVVGGGGGGRGWCGGGFACIAYRLVVVTMSICIFMYRLVLFC